MTEFFTALTLEARHEKKWRVWKKWRNEQPCNSNSFWDTVYRQELVNRTNLEEAIAIMNGAG